MKKISTIAIAMGAMLFLSTAANAQNSSSRNMERRDQNDQYNRDNDDDQYNHGNDNGQYNQRNDQYNQRDQVMNNHRPRITVVFGTNGNWGNGRYNDYNRYNDYSRYNDYRRYNDYDRRHEAFHRHEDFHRDNDYNNGCEAPRRYGY